MDASFRRRSQDLAVGDSIWAPIGYEGQRETTVHWSVQAGDRVKVVTTDGVANFRFNELVTVFRSKDIRIWCRDCRGTGATAHGSCGNCDGLGYRIPFAICRKCLSPYSALQWRGLHEQTCSCGEKLLSRLLDVSFINTIVQRRKHHGNHEPVHARTHAHNQVVGRLDLGLTLPLRMGTPERAAG